LVEQKRDTSARVKKRAKLESDKRELEKEKNTIRRGELRVGNLLYNIKEFEAKKKEGPTSVCTCCGGLWFQSSTRLVTPSPTDSELENKVFFLKEEYEPRLCETCYRDYRKGSVPRLALSNGIQFPKIPTILQDLTTLEERLCALRLPFMQIRSLGVDGQCGLRGNVVHIENDLDLSVAVLPRTEDESAVIPVGLVRHLDHQHPYIFQEIRPAKVYQAAKYLLTTPIYKEEGATLSVDWMPENTKSQSKPEPTEHKCISEIGEEDDPNPGAMETLIIQYNFEGIKIAPGQGKRPLSLLMDLNAESAAYPTIYGGNPRFLPKNMSPMDLWKSETRRYDRRYVINMFKILLQNLKNSVFSGVLYHTKCCTRINFLRTSKSVALLLCVYERRREKNLQQESS
jgi:hypothetical protein